MPSSVAPSMMVNVRRPKAIVFDILGTASKSGFLERILFPFLRVNLDAYIGTHWTKREFKGLYQRIVEQSIDFNRQEANTPIVLAHESGEAKASLMNFINFVTENNIDSPAVTQLRFKVWFEGYQQNKLKTPIYSDVPNRIRRWFAEGIKFYVFSNTWAEAQKALLRNTNHGDLTTLISGHFDNEFGVLSEPDSWRRLCVEIKEQPNDVLFLTKSTLEGHAAGDAGLSVVLVLTHRHNVKAISHEDRQRFPYVRSLNELSWLEGSMMPGASEMVTDRSGASGQVGPTTLSGISQSRNQPIESARTALSATSTNAGQTGSGAPMINQPLVGGSSASALVGSRVHSGRQHSSSRHAPASRSTSGSPHSTSTTATTTASSAPAVSSTKSRSLPKK